MSFTDYLINSLLGIMVVFLALISLMLIIKLITKLTDEKITETVSDEQTAQPVQITPVYAEGTAGEIKLYDTDPRDAAMIIAIVADESGIPLNELRFISIKEV